MMQLLSHQHLNRPPANLKWPEKTTMNFKNLIIIKENSGLVNSLNSTDILYITSITWTTKTIIFDFKQNVDKSLIERHDFKI